MKRAVVFLSFFLLLGVVLISGTGNIAFAGNWSPSTPEAVILYCTEITSTTPPSFTVTAISNATSVATPTLPADCAATLVTFKDAGLVIRDVHALNTSPAVSIVYTLVNGRMEN